MTVSAVCPENDTIGYEAQLTASSLQVESHLQHSSYPVICSTVSGRAPTLKGLEESPPLLPLLILLQVSSSFPRGPCLPPFSGYFYQSRRQHRHSHTRPSYMIGGGSESMCLPFPASNEYLSQPCTETSLTSQVKHARGSGEGKSFRNTWIETLAVRLPILALAVDDALLAFIERVADLLNTPQPSPQDPKAIQVCYVESCFM